MMAPRWAVRPVQRGKFDGPAIFLSKCFNRMPYPHRQRFEVTGSSWRCAISEFIRARRGSSASLGMKLHILCEVRLASFLP